MVGGNSVLLLTRFLIVHLEINLEINLEVIVIVVIVVIVFLVVVNVIVHVSVIVFGRHCLPSTFHLVFLIGPSPRNRVAGTSHLQFDHSIIFSRLFHSAVRRSKIQRWLLEWQAENLVDDGEDLYDGHLKWFSPGSNVAILLLPTPRSWEGLAYLEFFGIGPEFAVGLARRWAEQFGAELVAHWGTMLQFNVTRPPATLEQALRLAWEQETDAECTTITAGIPLFHHARVLVGRSRWFLHERP